MPKSHEARVTRHGTAIEIGPRVIRGVELARQLGKIGVGDVTGASLTPDGVLNVAICNRAEQPFTLPTARAAELVIAGARMMTCDGDPSDPLEIIDDGAIVAGGGIILWRGRTNELATSGIDLSGVDILRAGGALVTPGLIDCHTHLVYGGSRDEEFAMRARGATYREIAEAGGGIASTRRATLALDVPEMAALAAARLDRALAAGTTTIEAKSGYSLTTAGELAQLEAALVLDSVHAVDVVPTLLGAHVVPQEDRDDRGRYVARVAGEMIERAAAGRLCTSVDVYCDEGAFTLAETRTILSAARRAGLEVRAHVGQFADLGGPELLGELGALSADHLEEVSADGIRALASGSVVAVMLPTACVQLRQKPPPVRALRDAGVALAVASDMNPGSSPCETLAIPMWLAATHYEMTIEETWLGVTRHAARALGRPTIGTITVGAAADFVVWQAERPSEVPYAIGRNLVESVIKAGVVVR